MYVYMHVYVYKRVSICVCFVRVFIYVYTCICTDVCKHAACEYVSIHMHMYACIYIYIYGINTSVCTHVLSYLHTCPQKVYAHTCVHISIFSNDVHTWSWARETMNFIAVINMNNHLQSLKSLKEDCKNIKNNICHIVWVTR